MANLHEIYASDTLINAIHISKEAAGTLCEAAEAMPQAMQNIRDNTDILFCSYQSVEEEVGPYGDAFCSLLQTIEKFQENAKYSVEVLPHRLSEIALKLQCYR